MADNLAGSVSQLRKSNGSAFAQAAENALGIKETSKTPLGAKTGTQTGVISMYNSNLELEKVSKTKNS